jgi:hypothetical protein
MVKEWAPEGSFGSPPPVSSHCMSPIGIKEATPSSPPTTRPAAYASPSPLPDNERLAKGVSLADGPVGHTIQPASTPGPSPVQVSATPAHVHYAPGTQQSIVELAKRTNWSRFPARSRPIRTRANPGPFHCAGCYPPSEQDALHGRLRAIHERITMIVQDCSVKGRITLEEIVWWFSVYRFGDEDTLEASEVRQSN